MEASRPYLQCRLAGESDMREVLLQVKNLTLSESEDYQKTEITKSAYEPRLTPADVDSSTVSSTGSGSVRLINIY